MKETRAFSLKEYNYSHTLNPLANLDQGEYWIYLNERSKEINLYNTTISKN